MITLIPEGGLCNRMRAIASAARLAQRCSQPLTVQWYRTPDLNCRFCELFGSAGLPFTILEGDAPTRWHRAWWRIRAGAYQVAGRTVWGPHETAPGRFDVKRAVVVLSMGNALIRTDSALCQDPGMFGLFKPAPAPLQVIDGLMGRLRGSVGVHIRRTDNSNAIHGSPLEAFVRLMHNARERNPSVAFFVATDDPTTLHVLRHHFGTAVWEHPKRAYSRSDPVAIVDALVDLYGLAHCQSLIGSHWSSFTDTAAALRAIPLTIARPVQ